MKEELLKEFKRLYPEKRILAVQLNGFSHSVFFDNGTKESEVEQESYSAYAPEIRTTDFNGNRTKELLGKYPHYSYQDNAKEIVYVMPGKR